MNLFETEGRASEAEVVADPSGGVHVFWAYGAPDNEDSGSAQAIYYAHRQDGVWSEPVDILVSPGGRGARMQAVAADSQGALHIVWSGGNAIFYSRAYAPDAGSAQGWSYPAPLTNGVSALEPAIAGRGDNELYVLWTQGNAGLMFVQSQDGGQTWSTPQVIFPADASNELARWGRIAVDQKGRLHVAFTYTVNDPSGTYGRNDANLLYYLRSDDRGATWTEPLLVTPEPDFGEINVASIGDDTVHLVWNGRAGRHGRYHRWSQDGGETWSNTVEVLAPQSPIGDGGLTGFPALATDATGALHMVSATGGGDFYFRWADGVWSQPVPIAAGLDGNGVTGTANSLEQPSIALGEGNQLHAVFHDGFERIWYTGSQIDAPHQEAIPLPTTPAIPTPAATAPPPAASQTTPQPQPAANLDVTGAPPGQSSVVTPLLVSILPAVLVVGGVVVLYQMRRRR